MSFERLPNLARYEVPGYGYQTYDQAFNSKPKICPPNGISCNTSLDCFISKGSSCGNFNGVMNDPGVCSTKKCVYGNKESMSLDNKRELKKQLVPIVKTVLKNAGVIGGGICGYTSDPTCMHDRDIEKMMEGQVRYSKDLYGEYEQYWAGVV